ncbi:predicted protein [Postia placenta Mad-698-R]|uniref:Uncharacterized protein n=1 Tax=Postia placenta MAD-698-R-SB12 TaxID=670580 RepID=A0A1X6N5K9_9APHY|nr:hypothetical protein POSPLADRAFT_1138077 [Postia placenta MAD-698-R-SB12]EED81218.1 predicted protein [Postia placenta Mad-698-R]OSX63888.1 hypothetical protein POSPLADRAFT_1138077 [Postia placenta MAD-698-R-SB12]
MWDTDADGAGRERICWSGMEAYATAPCAATRTRAIRRGEGMGNAYDEISTKLRQPRDARSSSRPRSMKFASGERNDSIVLRRLRFDGVELVPDPDPDPDHHEAQSRADDGGGGGAMVIPSAEDSGRAGGHREGWTRPSSIASAAERLRWRVLTDTTERKDGLARRGTTAGADAGVSGRGRSAKVLAAVSGGLDVDAVGDTGEKRKYDWPAPGERIGEECRGGDMREGSEREGRCIGDVGETMDIAVVRQADRVSVRLDARRRREDNGTGGSGRFAEGAGLAEGKLSVSREGRRNLGTDGTANWENRHRSDKWAKKRTYGVGLRWAGELGSERPRPKDIVARVVTVSLRRRLMERMDWLSARSRERKERPSSDWWRRGTRVRNIALSLAVSVDERTAAWKLTVAVSTGAREAGASSSGVLRPERRPEVKRGEYCAKAESIAGVAVAVVVGEEEAPTPMAVCGAALFAHSVASGGVGRSDGSSLRPDSGRTAV